MEVNFILSITLACDGFSDCQPADIGSRSSAGVPLELFLINSAEYLQLRRLYFTSTFVLEDKLGCRTELKSSFCRPLTLPLPWCNALFMCFELSFDVVELKRQIVSKAALLFPSSHQREGPPPPSQPAPAGGPPLLTGTGAG